MKLGIIEQSGKGINTIVNHYGEEVFNFTDNYLQVNLPYNKNALTINETQNKSVNEPLKLSKSTLKVLELIKENANYTIDDMMSQLNLSRKTIKRALKNLIEQDLIIRIGSRKSGHWEIKE